MTHTKDAFESIMERLIEQKERELKGLRAEGHLEGLRAALAKYREEGGRDVITPEQRERLEFLSALEAAGVDNWSGYSNAWEIMEEWNAE